MNDFRSTERFNFYRLSLLILDVGTPALQGFFEKQYSTAGDLQTFLSSTQIAFKLQVLYRRKVISQKQQDLLKPNTGAKPSINTLDISLVTTLLTNLCNISKPHLGWKVPPAGHDKSIGADILRLRQARNDLYAHRVKGTVTDAVFHTTWNGLLESILRLSTHLSKLQQDEIQANIANIENAHINWERENHINELLFTKTISDILEKIQEKLPDRLEVITSDEVEGVADAEIPEDVIFVILKQYPKLKSDMSKDSGEAIARSLLEKELIKMDECEKIADISSPRRICIDRLLKKVVRGKPELLECFFNGLKMECPSLAISLSKMKVTQEDKNRFQIVEKSVEDDVNSITVNSSHDIDDSDIRFFEKQLCDSPEVIDGINDELLSQFLINIEEHSNITYCQVLDKMICALFKMMQLRHLPAETVLQNNMEPDLFGRWTNFRNGKPHRTVLKICLPLFERNLEFDKVYSHICNENLLDDFSYQTITKQVSKSEKIKLLLHCFQQRDRSVYERFKECLVLSQQHDLKIALEAEEAKLSKGTKTTDVSDIIGNQYSWRSLLQWLRQWDASPVMSRLFRRFRIGFITVEEGSIILKFRAYEDFTVELLDPNSLKSQLEKLLRRGCFESQIKLQGPVHVTVYILSDENADREEEIHFHLDFEAYPAHKEPTAHLESREIKLLVEEMNPLKLQRWIFDHHEINTGDKKKMEDVVLQIDLPRRDKMSNLLSSIIRLENGYELLKKYCEHNDKYVYNKVFRNPEKMVHEEASMICQKERPIYQKGGGLQKLYSMWMEIDMGQEQQVGTEFHVLKMESAKTSKYISTPESQNFAKVCCLFVELLRDVLWETLTKRILPEDLPDTVRQNKSRLELVGRMRDDQYRRICKPDGGNVSSEDFDISLLYILLRHLPMKPKIQGSFKSWGSDDYPDEQHIQEADDIERIRIKRNQLFAQARIAFLSKEDFDEFWMDMEAVVDRFDNRLSTEFKNEMNLMLKHDPSDFKNQEKRQVSLEAKYKEVETKQAAAEDFREIKKNWQGNEDHKLKMESAKSSTYVLKPERQNFTKVSRLFVDLLRDVLWETLTKRILPEDLPEIVRQNKSRLELAGRMTDEQYRRICKPRGINVSFEDFDISLLYILLKYLPMKPKIQGSFKNCGSYDYLDEKHIREVDDIERIRIKRNQLFLHAGRASLSKDEFDKVWTDMEDVVERFDRRLSTDFRSEMEIILKDDKFEEEYIEDFQKQKGYDLQTRQLALEAAFTGLEKIKKQIDETGRKLDEVNKKLDDLQKAVKEKKKDAEQKPNEILQNMLDKTREKLEDLKSEKAFFHQTKVFNQAKDLLLNKTRGYTIFLSGNPGEGKTTAGHMLLLEMQNSTKRCLIVNEPGDVRFVSPEHVDIIFVDDIFGNVYYDDHLNGLWRRHYEELKRWKKSKRVSFIFTSRELILRECRSKLDREDFFDRDGFILLSSEELNQEEKAKVLLKQLNRNKELKDAFPLKKEELTKCCTQFTSPFGFPLCCKVFSSHKIYLKQKSKFFSRPIKALEVEINELWKTDANKPMFVALAAVWMSNEKEENLELNSLHRRNQEQRRLSLSNFDTKKLHTVAGNLNVYLAKTFSIDELFEKLNGVYLIHYKQSTWQPEGYAFSHKVIEEAFGRVLAWTRPSIAVQYGSVEFLVNNTSTAKTTGKDDEMSSMNDQESLKIAITKTDFDNLFQRLMKSLKTLDDEFLAVHHEAFEDSNFLDFFLEKLSGTNELEELIVKKRGFAWGFTRTSFLKEALEQNVPKVELVSRILKAKLLDQIDDQRLVQEQKQSMFSAACRLGSYQLYKLLVQESVAITSNAFIRATNAGSRDIVEDLFQRAGLVQESSVYDRCLILASQGGFIELVELFVKIGAKLDTEFPPKNETPLYLAISQKHEDIALFLITKGADVEKIPTTKIKNSCLHVACQLGQTQVINALLTKRDIPTDIKNKNGVTPLHFALTSKCEEAAKSLIENGCNINLKSGRLDKTPLHISSEMGLQTVTQILLEKGADPMAEDKKGHSPMHYASMYGHKDIVMILIEANADQAESRMDKNGLAPIHYAARGGHVDVVRSLIKSGIDADLPDMYGRSPLYLAARFGHQQVVAELLKVENIDVNYKEKKNGFTPLHIATDRRHVTVVEKLCQHRNIHVNLPDKIGRTPLHIASKNGDKLTVKRLLMFQSDPRCVTENLDTPLHLIKNAGVAAVLLAKDGSVMNLKNKEGQSPLEIAIEKGDDILKVFENYKEAMEAHQS